MEYIKRSFQKIIFILTILLLPIYLMGLYEKIRKPAFKNLATEYYVLIGIILSFMVVSDINLIRHFQRTKK